MHAGPIRRLPNALLRYLFQYLTIPAMSNLAQTARWLRDETNIERAKRIQLPAHFTFPGESLGHRLGRFFTQCQHFHLQVPEDLSALNIYPMSTLAVEEKPGIYVSADGTYYIISVTDVRYAGHIMLPVENEEALSEHLCLEDFQESIKENIRYSELTLVEDEHLYHYTTHTNELACIFPERIVAALGGMTSLVNLPYMERGSYAATRHPPSNGPLPMLVLSRARAEGACSSQEFYFCEQIINEQITHNMKGILFYHDKTKPQATLFVVISREGLSPLICFQSKAARFPHWLIYDKGKITRLDGITDATWNALLSATPAATPPALLFSPDDESKDDAPQEPTWQLGANNNKRRKL